MNPTAPRITPPLRFPEELPITAHREAIADALARHRVLIVCGDTGSGKTTQLPKIALSAGRGQRGLIGITQPRRLAARAMATRVAEELGSAPGGFVGLQHRFERRLSAETRIKFMTDGILLAETRHDPLLRAYDTLIIDEAHERSLNIDFLLGILRNLLPRRPDLRVVISSATLDAERFAAFFADRNNTPAPVFTISGRLYPITLRYRPAADEDAPDLPRMIANAVDEAEGDSSGDVLVFLPGERDIREAADVLTGRQLRDTAVIPLLASLPAGEQQRAFRTLPGIRRIILATNVAETSITIPGIRTVIDSGLARMPRWNPRTRVKRLQIEAVSQASANQRAGRCGRIGPGLCIRLYSAEDFAARPPYTDPEIVRSSLAGVILTMLDIRLGDIATFPFIDPPPSTTIRDGLRELLELGAVTHHDDGDGQGSRTSLTPLGARLARLPLEPRFARILFAADAEKALKTALIVVAGLECDDPRRRPIEKQSEADAAHARFLTPASDFAAAIRLWRWYEEQGGFTSNTTARRLCRDHYLSFPRMRDWHDLRDQLARLVKQTGLDATSESGGDAGLHRALLAGLLGHIGKYDPETKSYSGAHGLRFALFPGSGLAKAKRDGDKQKRRTTAQPEAPQRPSRTALPTSRAWIIAGELIETSRLFARTAACIDLAWIEPIAGPLCKSSFHSPWWDGVKGFARVRERVTLHGLVLVENRTRDYSRINPAEARALFIRHGLVAGELPNPPPVIRENDKRLAAIRLARAKTRSALTRSDDDETIYAFYDARIPADVCSADALRRWLRQTPAQADTLRLSDAELPPPDARANLFPDTLTLDDRTIPLTYRHAPGEQDDGITCTVTVDQLPLLRAWRADWLVPGMLPDKVRWLLTALPAKTRRLLAPLDDTLARCLTHMSPGREPLLAALAHTLGAETAVRIPPDTWREETLPDWLRIRFVVTDAAGVLLGSDRNFAVILKRFAPAAAPARAAAPAGGSHFHRDGLTSWNFGDLPHEIDVGCAGWPIVHYPALVDASANACALRLFPDPAVAAATHDEGVVRLFALALERDYGLMRRPPSLSKGQRRLLTAIEATPESFGDDLARAAIKATFIAARPPIRTAAVFAERLTQERNRLGEIHARLRALCLAVLHDADTIERVLSGEAPPVLPSRPARTDPPLLKRPAGGASSAVTRTKALATFADLLSTGSHIPADDVFAETSVRAIRRAPAMAAPTALAEESADDLREQLAWMVFPGFIRVTPWARLQHYPRYLEGIRVRLERLRTNPAGDLKRLAEIVPLWQRYTAFAVKSEKPPHDRAALDTYRWLIEEYRISLFAQELRAAVPVSAKRLNAQWDKVER